MAKIPHIEAILPLYNEVKNIMPLVRQLEAAAKSLQGKATFSFLFINDGSTDGSKELLERLHSSRNDVRVIHLLHNFGHGPGLACGVEYFNADIALIMDSDGQDAPESLVEMFQAWTKGSKTVVAERGKRLEKNSLLFQGFYYLLHKVAHTLPPINFGTHCLLDKSVIERIRQLKEKNRYFPGLVGYSSSDIYPIRFDRKERSDGKSRVGMFGLINLAVTAFLSFSNAPIRLVSILGLVYATGAFLMGTTIVVIKIVTPWAIPGWASTMTAVSFGSGIQLLCLGIIGEYIARIFDEVKDRPLYLVDKILEPKSRSKQNAA